MRRRLLAAALLSLAAGCHPTTPKQPAEDGNGVHIAAGDGDGKGHVAISIPGFGGKVTLPDMNLGRHVDLDGIALAPDTAVHSIDVDARNQGRDGGEGEVRIGFTSPRAAEALIGWYRDQAGRAGFSGVTAGGGSLSADKGTRHFALSVGPKDGGSAGTITMRGGD